MSAILSRLSVRLSQLPARALPMHASLLSELRRVLTVRASRAQTGVSATLPAGRAARLMLRRGDTLLVRQGRLWLTREGDPMDHLLQPGCGHVASVAQEVVVEAVGHQPSRYELQRSLKREWVTVRRLASPQVGGGRGTTTAL